MWETILSQAFIVGLLAAGIRVATPILLAALGEIISEKAGVLNIGIEGMMLIGAFAAFIGGYYSGSPWLGLVAGAIAGAAAALVHAYLSVTLGTDQVVNGIAMNVFGWGLTSLLFSALFGVKANPPRIETLGLVNLGALSEIPILGPILLHQSPLVYIALAMALICSWILFRTDAGLALRAVGEKPAAADTAGINVFRVRYIAVLAGGSLAGLGGAFLAVGQLGIFSDNMTAGRGFIALAVVIFGRWSFAGTLFASFLFGLAYALQLSLQALGFGVPYQFLLMLPYVLTIVALVLAVDRRGAPAALALPYEIE